MVADEGSPFSIIMKEWGIERPKDVPTDNRKIDWFKGGKEIKGKSSLSRWSCGCQSARIGTKEFFAVCTKCNNPFEKVENKVHNKTNTAQSGNSNRVQVKMEV
jgi:hypothetical protein